MLYHFYILLVTLYLAPFALIASDTISIQQNQYFIDHHLNLVLTNADVSMINDSLFETQTHILLDQAWEFSSSLDTIEVGEGYKIKHSGQASTYTLYFTELPLIQITTTSPIIDEQDVHAFLKLIETDGSYTESHIGIQYRGGWSQSLPKKSLEIEFWVDQQGNDTRDIAVLGMREDDDWNLQAMYNEPLRIRSKTNFDLWPKINTLHYQDSEPKATNTVNLEYAEVFIGDEYRGVYCIGEKIDRKQLKLKSHNGEITGELYKGFNWGATTFGTLPNYDNTFDEWGGFEYKHPSEEVDWSNLYELIDFVINSDDTLFYETFSDRFEMDNLIDYFIFLNLLRATDNTGKNIYIAKYESDDKYFYVPWDLDGTWGTSWQGSNNNTTNDILLNGFYDRLYNEPCLADGFNEQLKTKWLALRESQLSDTTLLEMLDKNHKLLIRNSVYARESLAWPEYSYDIENYQYLTDWIQPRTTYLDQEFGGECVPISAVDDITKISQFKIYPNPTKDVLNITTESYETFEIRIYNQIGQLVITEMVNQNKHALSLNSLDKGFYTLVIESYRQVEIHKIIVE